MSVVSTPDNLGVHCKDYASDNKRQATTKRERMRRKASYGRKLKKLQQMRRWRSRRKRGAIKARKIGGRRLKSLSSHGLLPKSGRVIETNILNVKVDSGRSDTFHFYDSQTFQGTCVGTEAQRSVVGLRQAVAYSKNVGTKIKRFKTGVRYKSGEAHRIRIGQIHIPISFR